MNDEISPNPLPTGFIPMDTRLCRRTIDIKIDIEELLPDSSVAELSNSGTLGEQTIRGKSMLDIKSDRDVSYPEKQYLISKGWNPELF